MTRHRRVLGCVAAALSATLLVPNAAYASDLLSGPVVALNNHLGTIPNLQQDIVPQGSPGSSQLSSETGVTGLRLTAPFQSEPGPIRQQFGEPGPHPTASTLPTTDCGPFYTFYNEVLRFMHGNNIPAPCYGTIPEGPNSPVGYQFIYPTDLGADERVPVIVLSPGIGVEPGMMQRHAEFYASHGYVVALGYSGTNWFGAQMALSAVAAHLADNDANSPLYHHLDFSRTVLVGHSAGGGSALRMAGLMDGLLHQVGRADARVVGTVGINPGPADFSLASPPSSVPTLVLPAEHESLVPHPLSRIAFDRATGPKWWAVVKGAEHGVYLDASDKSVYDSLVVSFSDYLTRGDQNAAKVYEGDGYLLANDPELINVERY
ncbi:alpha/beta hydrolase [Corynebacterium uropygiale]|uniref:Alpha/beta hydrolase n=1 Tax=Corynebacterium uropygiale TaxID=1775911 RepID=A0A9X1QSE5_9CORY|nr:alpha/beta hydrolase [Corynebacterium uropygiale]MCF4007532.1 alpha/beta hydrolase [Corynebacterium uropygiale]